MPSPTCSSVLYPVFELLVSRCYLFPVSQPELTTDMFLAGVSTAPARANCSVYGVAVSRLLRGSCNSALLRLLFPADNSKYCRFGSCAGVQGCCELRYPQPVQAWCACAAGQKKYVRRVLLGLIIKLIALPALHKRLSSLLFLESKSLQGFRRSR